MITWIAKLRIWSALDAGKPLPRALAEKVERSEELSRFAEVSASLDLALKQSVPKSDAPAFLHGKIMRAVKSADRAALPRRQPAHALGWLPVPALALLLVFGVWWYLHQSPAPQAKPSTLAGAAVPLDLSKQITQTLPASVLAPLSNEWQSLNRDLENTADFLLASLP